MATSSITKNFIISGNEQIEKFINAVDDSNKESLNENKSKNIKVQYLQGAEELKKFILKRKKVNGRR